MKKNQHSAIMVLLLFAVIGSFNTNAQTYTCSYEMVALNNSSHGCNDGGINTTLPSNIYPSLQHDVYYNGSFVTAVPLANFAGTTFFSTVFFNGYGLGTWEYYAYYFDSLGDKVDCNYHKVIVSEPACDLTNTGFISIDGSTCSNGQISGTVSGNFCSQWTNTVFRDALDGPVVYSSTGSVTPSPFTVSNLSSGIYFARVTDGSCTSEYSTVVNSCPKITAGFGVSNITASQAKVKWNILTCALSYQVQYREVGTIMWSKKSVNTNMGSKLLTGLAASTTYEWQVRAKCFNNPVVWSAWSKKHTFTTAALRMLAENGSAPKYGNDLNLNLFPNPAHDQLSLMFESEESSAQLQIISMSGQIVLTRELVAGNTTQNIDLSSFPAGLYLLQIKTEDIFRSKLFEKE